MYYNDSVNIHDDVQMFLHCDSIYNVHTYSFLSAMQSDVVSVIHVCLVILPLQCFARHTAASGVGGVVLIWITASFVLPYHLPLFIRCRLLGRLSICSTSLPLPLLYPSHRSVPPLRVFYPQLSDLHSLLSVSINRSISFSRSLTRSHPPSLLLAFPQSSFYIAGVDRFTVMHAL